MYRHNALSIKETSEKMFVTSEEKQHIADIPNIKDDVTILKKLSEEKEVMYEELQGSYITITDTRDGSLTDLEILGNTLQDEIDFSDIKFVGKEREDSNYELELYSHGKNLFDGEFLKDSKFEGNGDIGVSKGSIVGKNYIKVIPNEEITLSSNLKFADLLVCEYDKNKAFLRRKSVRVDKHISEDAHYIRPYWFDSTLALDPNTFKGQVEKGSISTTYDQYQVSTSKIILPFQLKKVDSLSDRIFRREDGIWCIEKNIAEGILDENISYTDMNSNETWQKTNTSRYAVIGQFNFLQTDSSMNIVNVVSTLAACTTYANITHNDIEGVATAVTDNHYLNLSILKTKIGTMTIKDYLKLNPIKFWYKQSPEIIELPLGTQIQLNSFFGTTNIFMESGVVDGNIKCNISKSTGASINSLNQKTDMLSNRLEVIETIQESNGISISTDKDYVVCKDTREGYIKDIKIEGNTLVNILGNGFNGYKSKTSKVSIENGKVTIVGDGTYPTIWYNIDLFKPNTTYTFIVNVLKLEVINGIDDWVVFRVGEGDQKINTIVPNPKSVGLHVVKFTTPNVEKILDAQTYFRPPLKESHTVELEKIIILEGDHTNNPPEYFEGLLSTGQDKDILSITSSNKNLFSGDVHRNKYWNIGIGDVWREGLLQAHGSLDLNAFDLIYIKGVKQLAISYNGKKVTGNVKFFDKDKKYITDIYTPPYIVPEGAVYCCGHFLESVLPFAGNVLQIEANDMITPFVINKNDQKQILYKNNKGEYVPVPALRSVTSGVKDSIEKHSDGKYYYHKRCEEIVLNGSENWTTFNNVNYTNTLYARLELPNLYTNLYANSLVCDTVKNIQYSGTFNDSECIYTWELNKSVYLHLIKSRLTTQDLEGFKQWLANNPTTLVYQLAQEEVYECNDIEINSFNDETMVMLDCGVIPPSNLEFKTTSHIGDIITNMKDEVDKNTRFREEMTEAVTIAKESSNGFIHMEDTNEGIISVDRIEGNTLVNELPVTGADLSIYTSTIMFHNAPIGKFKFKDNTLYTLVILGTNTKFNGKVSIKNITGGQIQTTNFITTFTTGTVDHSVVHQLHLYGSDFTEADKANIKAICVEGDYTNNPPSYFEGLESVGQNTSLEILSNNSNLLNISNTKRRDGAIGDVVIGEDNVTITDNYYAYNIVKVPKYTELYISADRSGSSKDISIFKSTKDKPLTSLSDQIKAIGSSNSKFNTGNNDYISVLMYSGAGTIGTTKYSNVMLSLGNSARVYKTHKSTKKQILYKNSNGVYEKPILRGIPNGAKDTIEKHSDGKYYYHKRCEEVVLNGSEAWGSAYEGDTTNGFTLYVPNTRVKNGGNCISDKLQNLTVNTHSGKTDFVLVASGTIVINLLKSKLSSQDKEGFKAWLQQNPTTVVYELAIEEVYECNNLDLSSYEGETSISLDTTIPAKIKASTSSNLLATIDSLKKRINYLETEFSDMTENGSGWCKLPNGMIMQWGVTELSPTDYSKVCYFPISFSKNVVFTSANVIKNVTTNSSAGLSTFNVNAELMSGMSGVFVIGLPINIGVTDTYRVTWMAMGY